MKPSTTFYYSHDRDLASWRKRHADGDVPGSWPYGLDALSTNTHPVTADVLPPRSAINRVRGLVRVIGPSALTGSAGTGLSWDENAAHSLVRLRPRQRMYSGVIWLTDSMEANPDDDYAPLLRSLRRLSGAWVLSRAQLDPLRRLLGPDGPAVHHVLFGVDASFYNPQAYPETPMVLSVGGDRHRDPATLFRALELVHRQHPTAEIIVQSTSTLPVPPGVRKISHVSHRELRALYARASVVAVATSPNLHGSGMTVSLEALATARPVVLTRTPGVEDYVEHGVTGFLAETGSPGSIADAIGRVLADPAGAASMGRLGRMAVENTMTTRHLSERIAAILT